MTLAFSQAFEIDVLTQIGLPTQMPEGDRLMPEICDFYESNSRMA